MNRSPIQLGWLASSQVDVLLHCIDEMDAISSMLFQQVISVVFIYVVVDMRYLQKDIIYMEEFNTIESHRHLAGTIESMLAKLQLTGFIIDHSKLTLSYQGL